MSAWGASSKQVAAETGAGPFRPLVTLVMLTDTCEACPMRAHSFVFEVKSVGERVHLSSTVMQRDLELTIVFLLGWQPSTPQLSCLMLEPARMLAWQLSSLLSCLGGFFCVFSIEPRSLLSSQVSSQPLTSL